MNNIAQWAFEPLSIKNILFNLTIAAALGLVLKMHFEKFGSTLSGRFELARSLPFLVLIVCLIISVVKSSLALSLGLVGALSIVRFRTPVKEAEELVYIFMAIAIGLGLGANQTLLTAVATGFILTFVSILRLKFVKNQAKSLYLSLQWSGEGSKEAKPETVSKLIADNSLSSDLRRADTKDQKTYLAYSVNFKDSEQAFGLLERVRKDYPSVNASLIDQSRIPGV